MGCGPGELQLMSVMQHQLHTKETFMSDQTQGQHCYTPPHTGEQEIGLGVGGCVVCLVD